MRSSASAKRKPNSPQENKYGPAMYQNEEHGKSKTGSVWRGSFSPQPSRPCVSAPLRFFGHFNISAKIPRHFQHFKADPQNPAPFQHLPSEIFTSALATDAHLVSHSFHDERPYLKRISLVSPRFTKRFLPKPLQPRVFERKFYISVSPENGGGRGCNSVSLSTFQFAITNCQFRPQ